MVEQLQIHHGPVVTGHRQITDEFRVLPADRLYAQGGSAGGLLMGAVVNLRPDLFHGAIAAVPFVDVVTTMLDESISLTTFEWDEWGDPREPEYYEYMLSYSP
jgi:oligopeptidase B